MSREINVTNPDKPRKVLMVIANPPWHIEDAAKGRGANYIQGGRFKPFAVRDGCLITGQQQYSGAEVAKLVVEALGT
jgi:putative intracellular protease/amidase